MYHLGYFRAICYFRVITIKILIFKFGHLSARDCVFWFYEFITGPLSYKHSRWVTRMQEKHATA